MIVEHLKCILNGMHFLIPDYCKLVICGFYGTCISAVKSDLYETLPTSDTCEGDGRAIGVFQQKNGASEGVNGRLKGLISYY